MAGLLVIHDDRSVMPVCATWATLSVGSYRTKFALIFVVAALLGLALALAMSRSPITGDPPRPWWLSLVGPFITLWLTLIIVASLLVVQSCGYRLVCRTTPAIGGE
jgi:hypothetical protein